MGMDPALGSLPHELLADLEGWVPEGLPQTTACWGPVCWPYGVLGLEEVEEGKEAEGEDEAKEAKGNPEE